jgi:hypothetical protein
MNIFEEIPVGTEVQIIPYYECAWALWAWGSCRMTGTWAELHTYAQAQGLKLLK